MAGANKKVVEDAFKAFKVEIDDRLALALDGWCREILRMAIYFRMSESVGEFSAGHDFTGNLINSICVLLYRKSKGTRKSYFAYDSLKLPIRSELSGITARGRHRKNRIWFRPDWSGEMSALKGSELIPTDQSWGQNDAQNFARWWIPRNPDNDFVICVAYTSEYASFVEHERQTTGILQTKGYVEHSAVELVELKAA